MYPLLLLKLYRPLSDRNMFLRFSPGSSGILPQEHPAQHPVQEVSEVGELHHHEEQPQSLPTVQIQEVSVRRHVKRW